MKVRGVIVVPRQEWSERCDVVNASREAVKVVVCVDADEKRSLHDLQTIDKLGNTIPSPFNDRVTGQLGWTCSIVVIGPEASELLSLLFGACNFPFLAG